LHTTGEGKREERDRGRTVSVVVEETVRKVGSGMKVEVVDDESG
jgi:hypothetical protein